MGKKIINMILPVTSDVAFTMTIQGTFKKKEISESFTEDISKIARSSHSIAVVNDKVGIITNVVKDKLNPSAHSSRRD
jgi:hypothetical protein